MTRYVKAISALLGGIGTWGVTAYADNVVSPVEMFGLFGVAATALTVYAFPNVPPKGEPADPDMSEQGQDAI